MEIPLTPESEQLIRSKVRSGEYPSASEVVSMALRLLEEREHGAAPVFAEPHGQPVELPRWSGKALGSLRRAEIYPGND